MFLPLALHASCSLSCLSPSLPHPLFSFGLSFCCSLDSLSLPFHSIHPLPSFSPLVFLLTIHPPPPPSRAPCHESEGWSRYNTFSTSVKVVTFDSQECTRWSPLIRFSFPVDTFPLSSCKHVLVSVSRSFVALSHCSLHQRLCNFHSHFPDRCRCGRTKSLPTLFGLFRTIFSVFVFPFFPCECARCLAEYSSHMFLLCTSKVPRVSETSSLLSGLWSSSRGVAVQCQI